MPKVRIMRTCPETFTETEENIRWTDEIGEAEGMTEAEIAAMEEEILKVGRFWLANDEGGGTRCAYVINTKGVV